MSLNILILVLCPQKPRSGTKGWGLPFEGDRVKYVGRGLKITTLNDLRYNQERSFTASSTQLCVVLIKSLCNQLEPL